MSQRCGDPWGWLRRLEKGRGSRGRDGREHEHSRAQARTVWGWASWLCGCSPHGPGWVQRKEGGKERKKVTLACISRRQRKNLERMNDNVMTEETTVNVRKRQDIGSMKNITDGIRNAAGVLTSSIVDLAEDRECWKQGRSSHQ